MIDVKKVQEQFKSLDLNGWLEDWDIKNIYNEVSKLMEGQLYLEIGVAYGKSASIACLAANRSVKVKGIDTLNWKIRESNIQNFLRMNNKTIYDWEFIEGDSQLWAKNWNYGLIDVLFIDGNHTYTGVLKDIISWFPWVKDGGKIMFDDYNDKEEVKKAILDTIQDHVKYKNYQIDNEMFILTK